jgi:hypothetical protein
VLAQSMQADAAWFLAADEDRVFHRILGASLLSSLLLGAVVPHIPLPEPELFSGDLDAVHPVQLLAPRPLPVPTPAHNQTAAEFVSSVVAPQESVPGGDPQPALSEQGVLGMSEALARLQDRQLNTGSPTSTAPAVGAERSTPSDQLSRDITRISEGVSIGVTLESLLGAAELPEHHLGTTGQSAGALQVDQSRSAVTGQARSEQDIQAVLDRHKGEIYALYNKALRSSPELQGQILLRLVILPSGAVASCQVLEDNLGSPWLQRELLALVRGIDFGRRPGGSEIATRAPIEFFPQ